MATLTAGSRTTTNLTALQFPGLVSVAMADADVATINNLIVNDDNPTLAVPGAFSKTGLLFIPNRGVLTMQPGDWVLVTPEGWPILMTDNALGFTTARNGTPVTGSKAMVMASSVLLDGWQVGGLVASAGNITAGTLISAISADGLTITMSAVAIGSPGAVSITYGSFTHS